MDFPVKATVHLSSFPNKTQVREILQSHGFELTDRGRDQVLVKGSFLRLKDVKTILEQLQKEHIRPSSPSLVRKVSSGAIPKRSIFTPSSSPTISLSSPSSFSTKRPSSPINKTSSSFSSPRPESHSSSSSGKESFVVDRDVWDYAFSFRKKDIDIIINSHNVSMSVFLTGESYSVFLNGRSARAAVGKLQSLLDDLSRSLRTQEVAREDMNSEGRALLERIRKNRDTHNLVFVRQMGPKLHLVGPSSESYQLKQKLLGNAVHQSGRTGRTQDKSQRRRSSSEPPRPRNNEERGSRAAASPSPARAAGFSVTSVSESQQRAAATRNKSGIRGLTQLLLFNDFDIKRKLKRK